jgi:hypothetical protein
MTQGPPGCQGSTAHLTHCTIKGLTGGTTYAITVVARTTAGRSGASAPATVTPGRARARRTARAILKSTDYTGLHYRYLPPGRAA